MKLIAKTSKQINNIDDLKEIVELARKNFPISIQVTGHFDTDEEREAFEQLEEFCSINCSSVYMDGSATYMIRYRGDN